MGFFSPWFLGGLIAVGLPIYLHLLKRHKTDPQPFPSLMFFEHREQSSVQHRRLDYILLFILRTLMLLLAAVRESFHSPQYAQRQRAEDRGGGGGSFASACEPRKGRPRGWISPGSSEGFIRFASHAKSASGGTGRHAASHDAADHRSRELRGAVSAIKESDARASLASCRYLRTLSESYQDAA